MNPVAKKLSVHVEEGLLSKNFIFGDAPKIDLFWQAITELNRLEGLLLEERRRVRALEIELKKRRRFGKQEVDYSRVSEIFEMMGIK